MYQYFCRRCGSVSCHQPEEVLVKKTLRTHYRTSVRELPSFQNPEGVSALPDALRQSLVLEVHTWHSSTPSGTVPYTGSPYAVHHASANQNCGRVYGAHVVHGSYKVRT